MAADSDTGKAWVAGVFDRAAAAYDRVGDSYHDVFGERLVDFAGVGEGDAVLDVACGRGAVLLPAARTGPSGRAVGVDISPQMVEAARSAITGAGLTNAEAHVMDAEKLDIADATFDVVLCAFGVFFFPSPEQALAEFMRVVRPGGRVALSSWAGDDERWGWQDELLAELRVPRRAIVRPFDTPDELAQLLSGAGFSEVQIQIEQLTISFSTPEQWWDWLWSFSIRGVLEQLDEATRAAFKRAAFAHLESQPQDQGYPMDLTACFAVARKPT